MKRRMKRRDIKMTKKKMVLVVRLKYSYGLYFTL